MGYSPPPRKEEAAAVLERGRAGVAAPRAAKTLNLGAPPLSHANGPIRPM